MVECEREGGLYSVRKRKSKRDYLKEVIFSSLGGVAERII